jgi:ABC-type Fe3+ transport system substrate-binding protein
MKKSILKAGFAALVVLSGVNASFAQSDWDKVIAAAKKEGTVSVYHSQLGAPHFKTVINAFQTKYGIKVQDIDVRASELTERLRVEQTSGRYAADVEFHGKTSILQQMETNFVAKHGGVPNIANLRPEFQADEFSVPAWVQNVCMLVNTNLVKEADYPKEWKDILDPKWQGKMLSDDMRAVGSGQTVFAVLYKNYGKDFLERLSQQKIEINRDLRMNSRKVARGENALFITQILAFASDLKGLPVKVILPSDGCPYTPIRGAVMRGAPHPNAARLFINHFLDMESQLTYANAWMGTVVKGVAEKLTDPDTKRFAEVKLMGEIAYEDREPMLKAATEIMK